jgi:ketosteroid isomerase-like protein
MLLLVFAAALTAYAATEDELIAAEKQWAEAARTNNFAALEQLLAPDLQYRHSTGVVEDKAAYLTALRSKRQKYDDIIHRELLVRVYGGDAAVVTARMNMKGNSKGVPFDDHLLMIHVWVKNGGRWQLAAHQTTRLTAAR